MNRTYASFVPLALHRRREATRLDWAALRTKFLWSVAFFGIGLLYSLALMVLTTMMVLHWQGSHVSGNYPVQVDGRMSTLAEVCGAQV